MTEDEKPLTPEEEVAAIAIAQSGTDAVIGWMHAERLLRRGTTAIVVGFEHVDGRIVAQIEWHVADRSGLN